MGSHFALNDVGGFINGLLRRLPGGLQLLSKTRSPGHGKGVSNQGIISHTFNDMSDDFRSLAPEPSIEELREWEREFEAASRRSLRQRFKYAFIRTYKPVLDDARFRACATTREYREWCERYLPSWLGYGREV